MGLTWVFTGGAAHADLRIVMTEEEDGAQEYLMKDARILMPQPDGTDFLIFCEIGEFAIRSAGTKQYWQGTVTQFQDELLAAFAAMMEEAGAEVGAAPSFDELFSAGDAGAVPVRTSRLGRETVAGYEATRYLVEYEDEGEWRTHEETWVAPRLLTEIEAETGACMNTVVKDLMTTMVAIMVGDMLDETPIWSIINSAEYGALMEEGFPVRQRSIIEMFGMSIETVSELSEVSREPLDEGQFVIPGDWASITLLEAISP